MSLCNLMDKVQIHDLPHSGPSVVLSTLLPISSSHDISPTKRLIQLAPSCAPGFGIFAQAAPAFSCVCASSLSHVPLFATPWTVAHQAPLSMGILQARILEWVAMPSSRGSSQPRNRTRVSLVAGRFFTSWATREDSCILLSKTYPSFKTQLKFYSLLKAFLQSPLSQDSPAAGILWPVIYPHMVHLTVFSIIVSLLSLSKATVHSPRIPFTLEFSLSSTVTEVCSQRAGGNMKYRKSRDLARLVSDSSLADCESSGKEWSLPSLVSTSVKWGWWR